MFQRYVSILSLATLLICLIWWADKHSIKLAQHNTLLSTSPTPQRNEVIETLQKFAHAEHQFKNTHGHFTRIPSKLDLTLSTRLTERYAIFIQEASVDKFLISAISEKNGETDEFVSINQDFQLQANFSIPPSMQNRQTASQSTNTLQKLDSNTLSGDELINNLIRILPNHSPRKLGQKNPLRNNTLVIEPIETNEAIKNDE